MVIEITGAAQFPRHAHTPPMRNAPTVRPMRICSNRRGDRTAWGLGDSIVIIEEAQITTTAYTETTTYTESALELGAAYFFDDNYFIGVGLNSVRMSNEYSNTLDATLDSEDENSALGLTVGLGKFIPVRDNWYLTPNVNWSTYGSDDDINEVTQSGLSFEIGFGARF